METRYDKTDNIALYPKEKSILFLVLPTQVFGRLTCERMIICPDLSSFCGALLLLQLDYYIYSEKS